MLYKPKYCCNCGDRIERADWKIFSSRKFCELCETEYNFEEWLPRIAAGLLFIFGLWGFGSLFFQTEQTLVVKENFNSSQFQKNPKRSPQNVQSDNSGLSGEQDALKNSPTTAENPAFEQNLPADRNSAETKSSKGLQKDAGATVYFCGAETKKGTPCSRRVKGGGRCWQHKGREAMLPLKDLIADGQ